MTRAQKGATGNVHFSMRALMHNSGGVADALKKVYREPALVPASPWLGKGPPARPRAQWQPGRRGLRVGPAPEGVRLYVVRARIGGKWSVRIHPAADRELSIPFENPPEKVAVSAVDRAGGEGQAVVLGK